MVQGVLVKLNNLEHRGAGLFLIFLIPALFYLYLVCFSVLVIPFAHHNDVSAWSI